METQTTVRIKFLSEFKELFNPDWRNIAFYGGRGCFSPDTLVATPSGHKAISSITPGDEVLSVDMVGNVKPKRVIATHHYGVDFDPKPILKLRIDNEEITTTYDHKFYHAGHYVPVYQLAWGAMAPSQRIQLLLLCKQYGKALDDEVQGRPQDLPIQTRTRRIRVSENCDGWSHDQSPPRDSADVAEQSTRQSDSQPYQRSQDGQHDHESRVGNQGRADATRDGQQLDEAASWRGCNVGNPKRRASPQNTEVEAGKPRTVINEDCGDVASEGHEAYGQGRPGWQELDPRQVEVIEVAPSQATCDLTVEDYHNFLITHSNFHVHNSGKSQHVALALILRGRQGKLRILCTREIQKTIADSVHKLLKDIIQQNGFTDYEVTDKTIRNRLTGTEFIFSGLRHNVNEIKSMEGIDIAWVEEAQSISEDSLKVLAPTIRKEGSQIIFTFNRFNELDPVYVRYVMNKPAKTYARQVNYDVLERAGLLPESLKLELEADRHDAALFAHVWLGQPVSQADNAIIGREAILNAMSRTVGDDGAIEIGVDVARMGGDRTVFFKRKGLKCIERKTYTKLRTTEVCDKLEAFAGYDKTLLLKIDDTGVGGGVTDEMMKRGYKVKAINFGSEPDDKDKYPNLISEAWFYLASIMDQVEIPMDTDLLMELSSRQWKMDSKGRRGVESKDDYKKRGYRSPDLADALIMCFYTPQRQGYVFRVRSA